MSRYAIDATNPEHYAVVGYDRPLNHYFGEVHDAEGETVAETDFMNGVPTVAALVAFMAPYAPISEDLAQKLADEPYAADASRFNRAFNLRATAAK
jgi:hypothetical protein